MSDLTKTKLSYSPSGSMGIPTADDNPADLIEQLQERLSEYERLHGELAAALRHDAEAPSLCDLVAVARAVVDEKDELAVYMERLRKGFDKANTWEDVREIFSESPTTSLAERDAEVIVRFTQETITEMARGMPNSKAAKWDYYKLAVNYFAEAANEYAERVKRGEL